MYVIINKNKLLGNFRIRKKNYSFSSNVKFLFFKTGIFINMNLKNTDFVFLKF